MPSNTGLYYPWIHFRDDNWVKTSMLYWKRLQRIVPLRYEKHDSSTVAAFVERELITDVDAGVSAGRIAPAFSAVIRRKEQGLRARYGIDRAPGWSEAPPARHFQVPSAGVDGTDPFAFIHVGKIAADLREQLFESGLGLPNRGGDEQWFGVHPQVARVYMTALAEDIADRTQVHPVSADAEDLIAVSGWSVDRLAAALLPAAENEDVEEGDRTPAATLAFTAIRSVVPSDLSAISADKILEIRNTYGHELRVFQDSIKRVAGEARLADIRDEGAFRIHLQDAYEDEIAPKLTALERDLRLLNIETVPTYLGIKITLPPLLALGLAETAQAEPAVGTGSALLLGAIGVRQSLLSRARRAMEANPAAYMLRLKEELNPQSLRDKMRTAMRRFAIGV